ncbi:MAG: LysR family transcriptional regulator [Planctomycetaceae bacterium]
MPLRNVELFCDIVAHRSFSKAAAARNLSQPAVSQALHHLEERLGAQLIDRSKRPFELTPAGHLYYERCSRLIDEFRAAADEVHSLGGRVTGRLRVVSIYSVGLLQMQTYINRYREQFPHVELTLDYAQPDEVYARIQRDEADLGIVSFPKDGGDIGCIDWIEQEMVLVVPPEHRLSEQVSVILEQIEGEAFIAFTADLTIRRATDRLLRKHRISVNVVHQFNNIENIKRAVEIGLGISMLPLETVLRELEYGSLKAISLSDVSFHRPMGIVHKRQKHLSTAAERFIELLHESPQSEPVLPASSSNQILVEAAVP